MSTRLCLTKAKGDFAWMMSIPTSADATMASTEVLGAASQLLAEAVYSAVPNAATFDAIIGPEHSVQAFIDSWSSILEAHGDDIRCTKAVFASRVSYVTRESLAPLPNTPPPFTTTLARTEDLDALVPLYIGFRLDSPWAHTTTREEALTFLTHPVSKGFAWLCRIDGVAAGYVVLGRVTPRTIAVRNVYVAPEHRRKGIAEAMVRAVTRYYLGASPYGVEGVPEGPPASGFKEEVNLNVAEKGAERLYKRAGFLFPDDEGEGGVDPQTGRKAWYPSIWREVLPESSTE